MAAHHRELSAALNRIPGMGRTRRWVQAAVWERDGGRCVFPLEGGGVCGRTTDLFFEDSPAACGGAGCVEDFRVICVYHLAQAQGLHEVDWSTAGRA